MILFPRERLDQRNHKNEAGYQKNQAGVEGNRILVLDAGGQEEQRANDE